MTESAPMSLPDALAEQRKPCLTISDRHGDGAAFDVALYRYGSVHGGTECVATLDRAAILALHDRLTALLAR